MDNEKGLKRLIRFYRLLDDLYCQHVEEVKNAISDGEDYEEPTKEKTFDNIYNGIVQDEDLKFLTSDFIKQEINNYYDDAKYWYAIRKKYSLD